MTSASAKPPPSGLRWSENFYLHDDRVVGMIAPERGSDVWCARLVGKRADDNAWPCPSERVARAWVEDSHAKIKG